MLGIQYNVSGLKVSTTCRKDNPDTNISTALGLSSMVILSISSGFHLKLLLKNEINWKDLPVTRGTCCKNPVSSFDVSSRVIDFYRQRLILFVPLLRKHIGYKTVNMSYHFIEQFQNYLIFDSKHLAVFLCVYNCKT